MHHLTADQVKAWFQLQPNTAEGGYFASTYTSSVAIPDRDLPSFPPAPEARPICSAIYYFLDPNGFSAMHKVAGDMLYHFYSGSPVEMLLLYPDGFPNRWEVCVFSNDIFSGGQPMKVIPGGTWLGSRLIVDGTYALMGVSMAPGFSPVDYVIGKRDALVHQYPDQKDRITALTNQ